MNKFIKVTGDSSGEIIYINVNHIISISSEGGKSSKATIGFGDMDDCYYLVKETAGEVMRLINDANNK